MNEQIDYTAADFAGKSAAEALETLCPQGSAVAGVTADQCWEDETTRITFGDGSVLVICGADVEVVAEVADASSCDRAAFEAELRRAESPYYREVDGLLELTEEAVALCEKHGIAVDADAYGCAYAVGYTVV